MASKALLNTKETMLYSSLLCAYCSNELPEWAPTKTKLRVLQLHMWQSRIEIEYYSVAYFECITEFDAL